MSDVKPLSQCDNRWGYKKLGTSNKTICSHGCLITVVSIMAGTTPDIINQNLINVGGYLNQNLLIWNKLAQATSGILDFQYLHYTYDNDKVKEIIKHEGSCIVMVKHPSGFNHFVLYIGNGKMVDPLTGREENTSKYNQVIKFADVKVNSSNTNMTNWGKIEDELEDVTKLSVKLGKERDRLNKEIEKKDNLISKQSEDLLSMEEERNIAVNRAEKYFKEAQNKEELREKWFNANKKCQEALETCKIDRAAFQKRVTILEAGWEKPESIKTWLRAFINWIMKK